MKVNFEILYEHIGYLFYALAFESRQPSSLQHDKLRQLIDKRWKADDLKNDPLNLRLNEHLQSGVRHAITSSWHPEHAFTVFEEFYLVHRNSFGPVLKEQIQKSAIEIAQAFYTLQGHPKLAIELNWLLASDRQVTSTV